MRVLSSPSIWVLKVSHDHSTIHLSSCILGEQDENYCLRGRTVVSCQGLVWWANLLLYAWRQDRDLLFFISEPKLCSNLHKKGYKRFNKMALPRALPMTHFKLTCQNSLQRCKWTYHQRLAGIELDQTVHSYFICRARDSWIWQKERYREVLQRYYKTAGIAHFSKAFEKKKKS